MEEYISEYVKGLDESLLWKFFNLAYGMDDIVSLSIGEPDFQTPSHIAEEGVRAIREGHTYYGPTLGLTRLRESIASYYKRRLQVTCFDYRNVIVTVGASEAIDLVCRAILNPNDECIVCDPGYVAYEPLVKLTGAKCVYLHLKEENGFKITPEELEACISDKTKMIIMNYPSNPTGGIMQKEDYAKIVPILKKHNIVTVQDEIYIELTYGAKPCSLGIFDEMKDQLVILNGFSKAYSMTGWRIGYAIAPTWIIESMKTIHQYSTMGPTTSSQFAAIEATSIRGDKDIERHKDSFYFRRNYIVSRLNDMGLKTVMPEGAFYVFANIQSTGLSSFEFAKRLLYEKKVCVIPGPAFGPHGEGFVRISYAYSKEQLDKALDLIEEFIQENI